MDLTEDDLALVEEHTIPGGYAAAMCARTGDIVEIVDLEGEQVTDLIAFSVTNRTEWMSVSHTRAATLRLNLLLGDVLQSNWRRPMLEVVRDDVGMHDLITQMCDARRYVLDYGLVEGHRSCRSNYAEVLAPFGIQEWEMPDPLNVFQNASINADRSFGNQIPTSRPGDRIWFRVLTDLILAASACPQDLNPCNGFRPSPVAFRLLRGRRD